MGDNRYITIRLNYNHDTLYHLKKIKHTYPISAFPGKLKIKWLFLYVLFEKSIVDLFFCEGMFERTKKSPWKLLENEPQNSLKKVFHDLWEPWYLINVSFILGFTDRKFWRKWRLEDVLNFHWVLFLLFQRLSMKMYSMVYFSLSIFSDFREVANSAKI